MYEKANNILNSLPEEEKDKLESWVQADSRHTIAAGGIGQTADEMKQADKFWDSLEEETKQAYKELLKLHEEYKKEALQEAAEATGNDVYEIDPSFALGESYEAGRYISSKDY